MDILEQVQTCNLYVCILHQFCASLLFIYFLKLIINKIYIKINIHMKKIENVCTSPNTSMEAHGRHGKVCFMESISFYVLYNIGCNLIDFTIKFVTYKV